MVKYKLRSIIGIAFISFLIAAAALSSIQSLQINESQVNNLTTDLTDLQNQKPMIKIGEIVLQSNASSVHFTGLDGNKDIDYVMYASVLCQRTPGLLVIVDVRFNNNSNNFTRQYLLVDGVSVSSGRDNNNILLACMDSEVVQTQLNFQLLTTPKTITSYQSGSVNPDGIILFNGMFWYQNYTNINSIDLYSDVPNGIGKNSSFILYKRI